MLYNYCKNIIVIGGIFGNNPDDIATLQEELKKLLKEGKNVEFFIQNYYSGNCDAVLQYNDVLKKAIYKGILENLYRHIKGLEDYLR